MAEVCLWNRIGYIYMYWDIYIYIYTIHYIYICYYFLKTHQYTYNVYTYTYIIKIFKSCVLFHHLNEMLISKFGVKDVSVAVTIKTLLV